MDDGSVLVAVVLTEDEVRKLSRWRRPVTVIEKIRQALPLRAGDVG